MKNFAHYFSKNPIIATIRNNEDFEYALNSKVTALFILKGDILDLPDMMERCKISKKLVFLHIDFIKGIAKDKEGIIYLSRKKLCHGIVTTKSNLIEVAKNESIIAVQRLFLLDSAALKTGEQLLIHHQPDAVEILPGIAAPYFIDHIHRKLICPVIAGGLIREKNEIDYLFNKGVLAISTSRKELW